MKPRGEFWRPELRLTVVLIGCDWGATRQFSWRHQIEILGWHYVKANTWHTGGTSFPWFHICCWPCRGQPSIYPQHHLKQNHNTVSRLSEDKFTYHNNTAALTFSFYRLRFQPSFPSVLIQFIYTDMHIYTDMSHSSINLPSVSLKQTPWIPWIVIYVFT